MASDNEEINPNYLPAWMAKNSVGLSDSIQDQDVWMMFSQVMFTRISQIPLLVNFFRF